MKLIMKVYQSAPFESEVIPLSSYRALDEKDLSEEEKVILCELNKMMKEMGVDRYYYLGNYLEQEICLFKKDDLWEVYITERGNCYNKVIYDNCLEACIEVIVQASDSKQEVEVGITAFKHRVRKRESNNGITCRN